MLQGTGLSALGLGKAACAQSATADLPFPNGTRPLVRYPQKRLLLRLTARPPQLETPFAVYDDGLITPNDAFFVRYHLANIPFDQIDPASFRLTIGGAVQTPLSLTLAELKAMPAREVTAVAQCSGNSRGFFTPRVAGGQAGNGLMGNAVWRGVALRDVLEQAGLRPDAVQLSFNGMDSPVLPETPDFVKALDVVEARDPDVLLAYSMNGQDLPVLNGFPLRLVVPGYFATYWVKHLHEITALDKPLASFWMTTAYRIPDNDCACVPVGATLGATRPIGRYAVRSFITNLNHGAKLPAGQEIAIKGIAFDGGSGIRAVDLSTDGGSAWVPTTLGPDLGRYSFRGFMASVALPPGLHTLLVRAASNAGEVQPAEQRWNPSGYMRNVIEAVSVTIA